MMQRANLTASNSQVIESVIHRKPTPDSALHHLRTYRLALNPHGYWPSGGTSVWLWIDSSASLFWSLLEIHKARWVNNSVHKLVHSHHWPFGEAVRVLVVLMLLCFMCKKCKSSDLLLNIFAIAWVMLTLVKAILLVGTEDARGEVTVNFRMWCLITVYGPSAFGKSRTVDLLMLHSGLEKDATLYTVSGV